MHRGIGRPRSNEIVDRFMIASEPDAHAEHGNGRDDGERLVFGCDTHETLGAWGGPFRPAVCQTLGSFPGRITIRSSHAAPNRFRHVMPGFTEFDQYDGLGLAQLVRDRRVSPAELVDAAIERIERGNPALNAVVTPMFEIARRTAGESLPD